MALAPVSASFSASFGLIEALTGYATDSNLSENDSYSTQFGSGTGTGNINLAAFSSSGSLSASASVTIDLASYPDKNGNTVSTMTKLKVLWVKNTGTVAIDIGAAASNQFIGTGFLKDVSDIFTLAAGQVLPIVVPAGITVSGTCKSLKLLNTSGATTATYKIIVVGSSS